MIDIAIWLIVVIAVFAVVQWFISSSGVSIPRPAMIVIYAVIAIVAILFLAQLISRPPNMAIPR